jgi:hypothetical protein
MMSNHTSSNHSSKQRTAYDAFASVDELVAKPVLGSDGAALWQAFGQKKKRSIAPKAPLKAADRAAGFHNWEDERQQEEKERQKAGHKSLQESGYTVFQQKGTDDNPIDWTAKRKRPDHVTYYIAAEQFEGSKFDYVFTTRDRGTGYYWDGMDSLKQKAGIVVHRSSAKADEPEELKQQKQQQPAISKKKKSKRAAPIIRDDPNNPFEQVAAALQRKLQSDWKTATDPATGKTYYYNTNTGERSWNPPLLGNPVTTTAALSTTTPTTNLPNGWQAVQDPASGLEYYYHTDTKQTQWERPTM